MVATLSQEVVAQVIEPAATCAAFPTGNLSLLYRTDNGAIVITTGLEEAGVSLTLLSIESNEPMSEYDIQSAEIGTDDRVFWLKGVKNTDADRIYTVTCLVTDSLGNTNMATVFVTVP